MKIVKLLFILSLFIPVKSYSEEVKALTPRGTPVLDFGPFTSGCPTPPNQKASAGGASTGGHDGDINKYCTMAEANAMNASCPGSELPVISSASLTIYNIGNRTTATCFVCYQCMEMCGNEPCTNPSEPESTGAVLNSTEGN